MAIPSNSTFHSNDSYPTTLQLIETLGSDSPLCTLLNSLLLSEGVWGKHNKLIRLCICRLSATKTLDNLPPGAKISLTLSGDTKGFVGNSATQFATECGITIRNYCPMNFHTWESVPDDVKNMLYEKLQGRFNLLRSDRVFMEHVNARLHAQWKRTRGTLSAYWKKNGGKTNPQLARSKMMPNCRNQEDWNHLCDYWELEKTRKYNDQMEANRGKQVIASRGGSRSISNHRFHLVHELHSHLPRLPPPATTTPAA
ncbi:hypothetical protein E3N88_01111 [Mikania micrantha]|uniref:Uncharacterized protein n=1 Tax=Mikania micrantha TaxID=192012 RepID=A0A5N6Q027_9ASTR|nr:hypothetical protein E3N88_01111 [Mikania micrantha]